jgi:hypothetical protein
MIGFASVAGLDPFPFPDSSLRKWTAMSFLPFVSNRSAIRIKKSFEPSGVFSQRLEKFTVRTEYLAGFRSSRSIVPFLA